MYIGGSKNDTVSHQTKGVNQKGFYLLLYLIALRTLSHLFIPRIVRNCLDLGFVYYLSFHINIYGTSLGNVFKCDFSARKTLSLGHASPGFLTWRVSGYIRLV